MRWLLLLALAACKTVANPIYCTATADCADVSGRPFCDLAGDFDLKNTCVADPMTCDAERPCEISGFPACVAGTCKQCDDNGDCTVAGATACSATNVCVECTTNAQCSGTRPVCNTDAETCRGCTADDECATGACNKATGACHVEGDLIFVANGGGGTACTRAAPCGTMHAGLDAVIGTRDVILVSGTYTESLAIMDFDVSIKGPTATLSGQTPGEPVIRIQGNKPVRIEGLTISTGDNIGVRCTGSAGRAALVLEGVTIQNQATAGLDLNVCDATLLGARIKSSKVGITTMGASLTMRRCDIRSNSDGGIRLDTTDYDIESSIIALNGTDGATGSTFGGVLIATDAPGGVAKARFDFNTVAFNVADDGTAEGVACGTIASLTFNNNIVVGSNSDPVVNGGACAWRYSAFNLSVAGTGNLNTNPKFKDVASDFHLDTGSPCVNQADPTAAASTDFDGQARPFDGRSDIGADELQ